MKISEKWLRSWVDPSINTNELCEQLTNLGLEVDSYAPTYEHLTGVVVAEIEVVTPLDGSAGNTLTQCTVNTGSRQVKVVCGAPNVRVGMKTAYAEVGASLNEQNHIQNTRIHGVESEGMLCSGSELGINCDAGGILDLAATSELGADIKHALNLNDHTIDIDLTPNRGDCLSLRGIAREIGVINRLTVLEPKLAPVSARTEQALSIELENPVACPRYLGRVITNVDSSAATPDWMVQRITGCGLRPINPIVDVTNYVMLELGQPLHAFDLSNVRKGIVVRNSRAGEQLKLLDGAEIEFEPDTLLITDGEVPLAIAGVIGGEHSGIQPGTTDVFLECAYFAPSAILGTPRIYGLQTDASLRYERGVDPCLQHEAIERASQLLCEIVGGDPGPISIAESVGNLPAKRSIGLRQSRLTALIGESIGSDEVEDIFARLGLTVSVTPHGWTVEVPSYRFDLAIEEDLVEEVCRVYGYNRVKASHPLASLPFVSPLARTSESMSQRNRVVERGYYEVINYSFIDREVNDRFIPEFAALLLKNPIASQYESMRKSLLPGLVVSARANLARQQETVRLFEYGKCFWVDRNKTVQRDRLSGIVMGLSNPESWAHDRKEIDFFDIKGDLEHLLALLGTDVRFERSKRAYLHPGEAARILTADDEIGHFGKLHPELSLDFDLPDRTFVFELNADPFKQSHHRIAEVVAPFPYVRRDLALLLANEVSVQDLCVTIRDELKDLLVELTVFDVYEGDSLAKGQKSVTVGLLLQNKHATLTDMVVNDRIGQTLIRLSEKLRVNQR